MSDLLKVIVGLLLSLLKVIRKDEAWYITIPAASPSHTFFMKFTTGGAINQIYDAQYHFAAVRLVKDT